MRPGYCYLWGQFWQECLVGDLKVHLQVLTSACMGVRMGNAALPVTAASLVYAVEVSSSKNELQGRLAPSAVTHPTLHPYSTKQQANTFAVSSLTEKRASVYLYL